MEDDVPTAEQDPEDGLKAVTLHTQVVRRACDVVGMKQLANRLHVSLAILETWTAGHGCPPPRVFFRLLDILQKADPTYRPHMQ